MFGTTKKIVRLLYKLSNKHSNEKLFFIKVVSISRFHYKSFIKSLKLRFYKNFVKNIYHEILEKNIILSKLMFVSKFI